MKKIKYFPFREWKFHFINRYCIVFTTKERDKKGLFGWIKFFLKDKELKKLFKILVLRKNPYGTNCIHN